MWVGFWVHCQCEVVVFVHKVFLCVLLFSSLFSVGLLPFSFWLLWCRHVSLAGFPRLGLALSFDLGVLSPSPWGDPRGLLLSSLGRWVDMVVVVGGHLVRVTCHTPDFSGVIKERVA